MCSGGGGGGADYYLLLLPSAAAGRKDFGNYFQLSCSWLLAGGDGVGVGCLIASRGSAILDLSWTTWKQSRVFPLPATKATPTYYVEARGSIDAYIIASSFSHLSLHQTA